MEVKSISRDRHTIYLRDSLLNKCSYALILHSSALWLVGRRIRKKTLSGAETCRTARR